MEEEIPEKSIEGFVNNLPSSKEFPLEQDAKFSGLARNLGAVEALPEIVQQKIQEISEASTVEEKAAIAHSFTHAYMDVEQQFGGELGQERIISFDGLALDPRGDCDDFAKFNAGLLVHGGVDPRDIFTLSGLVEYSIGDTSMSVGHKFVVVRSEDQYLLMDNNLQDVLEIDPRNPAVTGSMVSTHDTADFGEIPEITAKLNLISGAVDARGSNFSNPDAFSSLEQHME